MNGTIGIRRNGTTIAIQKWETHKNPVLAVYFEEENCWYKVASFNSEKTADWFAEIAEEFFSQMVGGDAE